MIAYERLFELLSILKAVSEGCHLGLTGIFHNFFLTVMHDHKTPTLLNTITDYMFKKIRKQAQESADVSCANLGRIHFSAYLVQLRTFSLLFL